MPGAIPAGSGRKPREEGCGAASVTGRKDHSMPEAERVMEEIVSRGNMMGAYSRVVANKGAAGVDGMPVTALMEFLRREWERIKEELLAGVYAPQLVRKVEIPKPGGGSRMLGIPTVLDRLIQQAVHQVLSPCFDPDFSEHSYGFRPGRGALNRRSRRLEVMSPKGVAGWWTWTWKSSLIASTTIFLCRGSSAR